ncbi:MAG: methyltransferase domain-containing protein [Herbaspirillum sp.]|nr:methyltransferase domain-containing protein [Herbaspirillum sp.]
MQEKYDAWENYYSGLNSLLFPNEYVLRSFVGGYPKLKIDKNYRGKKICDVSCGDGRNMVLLDKLGFELYGTEVTEKTAQITQQKLLDHPFAIKSQIKSGTNVDIPFDESFFDYLLSWNAIYYLDNEKSEIGDHVAEYARVLKSGGYMVCSVPTRNCYSLLNCNDLGEHRIRIDPPENKWGGGLLKGTLMYRFDSFEHIEQVFGSHFTNFSWAKLSDDCFGLPLEYFIFVCQKK